MMNHKRFSVPRFLPSFALAIILTACSSAPKHPTHVDITLAPSQSTQDYMIQADSSQGSLQNDWLIMATKSALKNNALPQAEMLIKRLAKQQLSIIQQAEWQIVRATLSQKRSEYKELIQQLNFKSSWKLADVQWQEYHSLKANAYQHLKQYFMASREWIKTSQFAKDTQQQIISDQIWQNLNHYSTNELNELRTTPNETVLQGWLQLATMSKSLAHNMSKLQKSLQQWLAAHPTHPAVTYTPAAIKEILSLDIIQPTHTALLLPLTGRYSKQGKLIRDGFILTMMNDQERDPAAKFTIIDTNSYTIEQIKQRISDEGIDFIVGPLQKNKVETLQQSFAKTPLTAIPTLALNIPEQVQAGQAMCYLSLSPEQEVAQAAKHLFSEGFKFPLILAPKGSFGQRIVAAFDQEWQKHSQNKVSTSLFANKRQLQKSINQVFGVQDSKQRISQIETLTGLPLISQPRSRRDIDSVYIVAKSSELTLIKPFIEVAVNPDAKPPQLFSNSRSHSNNHQYEDLSGIIFSDIPLLLNKNPSLNKQIDKLWPDQSNMAKRLQALGMDAYNLMAQLPQMKVVPSYVVQGETGTLSIDNNCVVQREINWAEHDAL